MKNQSKIIEELIKTLKENKSYIIENKLNKTLIVDHAFQMNEELLTLLINNKHLKNYFFANVNKTLVFDKIAFQEVITNKQLLDDSFTKYKKDIGLNIEEPSANFNNVVLDWPYKDCLLEGGQSNEDETRNEIFWNNTLAKSEIGNLLTPKVLTNFNFYGDAKKEDLKYDNQVIFGNNLVALHSIKKAYAGKVQAIYCDPPYNTGKDSFGYNDRFNHSTWLTFFKNRMEVCRDIMNVRGSIWISLDDREVHYAKVLLDGIFGRENFISSVIWEKKYAPQNDAKYFSDNHDHILVYAKDKMRCLFNGLPRTAEANSRYTNLDNDSRGPWKPDNPYVKTYSKAYDYEVTLPSGRTIKPAKGRCWRCNKEEFQRLVDDNRIWFGKDGNNIPAFKRFLSDVKQTITPLTVWRYKDEDMLSEVSQVGHNQNATKELKEFHDLSKFNTPKPEHLIKRILDISSNEQDIVLDPFAGSGTTAAVALKMKRKFITCEQMDYGKDIIINRLQQVINQDQGGISDETSWEGGGGFCSYELKKLNQDWIEKIVGISTIKDLKSTIKELINHDYLSVYSDTNKLLKSIEETSVDSLEFAKATLIEILDKSQLYLSYSEIEDKRHEISKEEIALNHLLYK